MNSLFDFSNIKNVENTIIRTWDEFRKALALNKFAYDDIDSALNETFLKVFNDLLFFRNNRVYYTKELRAIKNTYALKRGAIVSPEEDVTYDRFIPNKKYIREDNRFSPHGVEWLYLAMSGNTLSAEKCCEKECQVKSGDVFASCSFDVEINAENKKVIDLTIGTEYTFNQINNNLKESEKRIKEKAFNDFFTKGTPIRKSIKEFEMEFTLWLIQTDLKLMSEQLFLPVDVSDKSFLYAPFQCLAKYFISKGYDGIIYSSAVYRKGKNIVLFDKEYAHPVGKIKKTSVNI